MVVNMLMGTVLGFLSGLGTGGGSLLILWLTMGVGTAQGEAQVMNLMFFIPSALVACLFRWKQGKLNIKKVVPAIIAGTISAALFAFWGQKMDTSLLKRLFGALLIFTGIRELMYQSKKR
jgi:uncharacterized membrane protein YfcA